jgi:hypothetical protein
MRSLIIERLPLKPLCITWVGSIMRLSYSAFKSSYIGELDNAFHKLQVAIGLYPTSTNKS